jgi:hypothetical protein
MNNFELEKIYLKDRVQNMIEADKLGFREPFPTDKTDVYRHDDYSIEGVNKSDLIMRSMYRTMKKIEEAKPVRKAQPFIPTYQPYQTTAGMVEITRPDW